MVNVDLVGFIFASIAVVLTPGPGSFFVAKTAGAKGVRAGRMAMLGIILGDTCLIAFSLLGLSALFRAPPALFHAVRLAGAGYLLLLGIQSISVKKYIKPAAFQNPVLCRGLSPLHCLIRKLT